MTGELGTLAPVNRSGRPVGLHRRSTDAGGARGLLEEMLGRTARGDQAAFGAVYDAMKSPVFGIVVRVVRDPAQSEEVTQEVFIDVWRHAARFDPEVGSARTWIMTMAHRRAVDRVRLQRESVTLAYYDGFTYPEVAKRLDSPLGTIKTRMRDGLVRLRDCLGVSR